MRVFFIVVDQFFLKRKTTELSTVRYGNRRVYDTSVFVVVNRFFLKRAKRLSNLG